MTTQISLRLPDDLVEFMDQLVADGAVSGRADLVTRAVDHERRRTIAERDAFILANAKDSSDLDALASYAARTEIDLD